MAGYTAKGHGYTGREGMKMLGCIQGHGRGQSMGTCWIALKDTERGSRYRLSCIEGLESNGAKVSSEILRPILQCSEGTLLPAGVMARHGVS